MYRLKPGLAVSFYYLRLVFSCTIINTPGGGRQRHFTYFSVDSLEIKKEWAPCSANPLTIIIQNPLSPSSSLSVAVSLNDAFKNKVGVPLAA